MMKINDFGTLYVVATPLGNLQDMTYRGVQVLQSVDVIAAEDTRHSSLLLQHYQIKTPLISLHEHNEHKRTVILLERLKKGESIALISDAGTPLISDPGYVLAKEARQQGITIVPIPGPCAAIAALSASGLPTDKFIFEGFLPSKAKQRKSRLSDLAQESRTLIFYESPHRVLDMFKDMQEVFGDKRIAVVARELTKRFETIRSGTLEELVNWIEKDANQERGEIVVLLHGIEQPIKQSSNADEILSLLLECMPTKKAVEVAAKVTGQRKNDLYASALHLKSKK